MIEFRKNPLGETVTEELLQEFETTMGSPLPQDYRQHMLEYNGGMQSKDGLLYSFPILESRQTPLIILFVSSLLVSA